MNEEILDIEVRGEADASELRDILYELTDSEVSSDDIGSVLRELPGALALWLEKATPEPDGSLRGEWHNGLILHLKRVPESENRGVAEGTVEPEHYALYVKFHAAALKAFSNRFAMPVKNG